MVGGMLIGCYRVETGEFVAHDIPICEFQAAFASRHYLHVAWTAAQLGMMDLARKKDEPVQVCQGFVNSEIRRMLGVPGSKITGPFQARIEQALRDYLNGLGFPFKGSTEEYGKLFFESVRWLKGGNPQRRGMDPERVKLAKSGWRTFPAYQKYPYTEAKQVAAEIKRSQRRGRWNGHQGDDE